MPACVLALRTLPRLFRQQQERGRNMGYMMNLYTPMTSANTTPATTPGSTPPSGADAYDQEGGKSNGVVS